MSDTVIHGVYHLRTCKICLGAALHWGIANNSLTGALPDISLATQ